MEIQQSAEDYLESILVLKKRIGQVRSIDIVHELGYTKPSVSVAMKKLRENDYITMDKDGYIELLPAGEEVANSVYRRHQVLSKWLISLGVSEETAEEDACKIEHVLSDETFEKLHTYVDTLT